MSKRHFMAVLVVLLLVQVAPAEQLEFMRMWKGKDLWQFGHSHYQGQEDSWKSMPGLMLSWNYDGEGPLPEPIEVVIPLDEPLPFEAGPYRLYVKNFYRGKMDATLGDITAPLEIKRYDWSPVATFEPNAPVDKIVLRYFPNQIVRDTAAPQSQNQIVQGVFLTTQVNKVPIKAGEIISLLPLEAPLPREGNVLQNASFEAGLYPWGKQLGFSDVLDHQNLDTSTAVHGKVSLRVSSPDQPRSTNLFGVETKLYELAPGRYTLSFSAKADRPVDVTAEVAGLNEALQNYAGAGLGKGFMISDQWQRYEVSGDLEALPGFLYTVRFTGRGNDPATFWLDAVQLRRGDAGDLEPALPLEVGYVSRTPGHIYYEGEAAMVDVLVSGQSQDEQANLIYRIEDYWGNEVDRGVRLVVLELEAQRPPIPIELFSTRRGIFRVLFAVGASKAEMTYCVLPPNPHLNDLAPHGTLGTDAGFNPKTLRILKRANFNCVLSKSLVRWSEVEPEEGVFVFDDQAIANARDAKMAVVLQFLNPEWGAQKWLRPYLPPKGGALWESVKRQHFMDSWARYVRQTVHHFGDTVHHWEIWNEPNAAFNPADYAQMLSLAHEVIEAQDPKAKVVGFAGGGFNEHYYREVIDRIGVDAFDVVSVHLYGNDPQTHTAFRRFLEEIGKPGWNTETGPTAPSFFTTLPNFDSIRQKDYWADHQRQLHVVTNQSVHNYLTSLSLGGMERWFHYFARFANAGPSQPTRWFGSGKEIAEFDGSLRANGVALSIASHFIDGSRYDGSVAVGEDRQMHLFVNHSGTVGFAWATAGQVLTVMSEAAEGFNFYDVMGNRIEGLPIVVGESPVYFTSPQTAEDCRRQLQSVLGAPAAK